MLSKLTCVCKSESPCTVLPLTLFPSRLPGSFPSCCWFRRQRKPYQDSEEGWPTLGASCLVHLPATFLARPSLLQLSIQLSSLRKRFSVAVQASVAVERLCHTQRMAQQVHSHPSDCAGRAYSQCLRTGALDQGRAVT